MTCHKCKHLISGVHRKQFTHCASLSSWQLVSRQLSRLGCLSSPLRYLSSFHISISCNLHSHWQSLHRSPLSWEKFNLGPAHFTSPVVILSAVAWSFYSSRPPRSYYCRCFCGGTSLSSNFTSSLLYMFIKYRVITITVTFHAPCIHKICSYTVKEAVKLQEFVRNHKNEAFIRLH